MDEVRFNRFESKLDKISEKQSEMNATLAVNTDQLAVHIKRTAALEERIEPIEKHVMWVQGGLKLIGGLSILAGLAAAIKELIHP